MRLKEISEICNVSMSTVSRVLNNKKGIKLETRKRVFEAHNRLLSEKKEFYSVGSSENFFVGSKNAIDLLVPDLTNPFFSEFAKNIIKTGEQSGFEVRLWDTDDSIEKEIEILKGGKERESLGVILISSSKMDKNSVLAREIAKLEFPIVLADKTIKNCNLDGIFVDNIRGGEILTQHLLDSGKNRIAIVSGAATSDVSEERVMGFYNVLERAGIEWEEEKIVFSDFYDREVIEKSLDELFQRKNFDSIICCNNIIAQCVIKKMLREGLSTVTDFKVVSFDKMDFLENIGIFIDYSAPEMKDFAYETFELLQKKIKSPSSKNINTIKITPQLFCY